MVNSQIWYKNAQSVNKLQTKSTPKFLRQDESFLIYFPKQT